MAPEYTEKYEGHIPNLESKLEDDEYVQSVDANGIIPCMQGDNWKDDLVVVTSWNSSIKMWRYLFLYFSGLSLRSCNKDLSHSSKFTLLFCRSGIQIDAYP